VHLGSFYNAQPVPGAPGPERCYQVAPVQQEQKPVNRSLRMLPRVRLDRFGQNPLGIFDSVKNKILIGHKRNSATELGFK